MDTGCVTIASNPVDYTSIPLAELIDACARGENAAWKEFIQRYGRIIAITAARIARCWGEDCPDAVDDLVQDTYLKLSADKARVLRGFRFDNPDAIFGFLKFLKVVTRNVVNDVFKKHNATKRNGGITVPFDEELGHGAVAAGPTRLTTSERKLLLAEVYADLGAKLPPETRDRDLTIFLLYFRRGLTAKQIAGLSPGLTVKGVESVLHRLIQLVREFLT